MTDIRQFRPVLLAVLASVAVSVTLAGCARSPAVVADESIPLGKAFTLGPGNTARVDGGSLTVRFDGVRNDSRCPAGITCVWQGDAVVMLSVAPASGSPIRRELHTVSTTDANAAVSGRVVKLLGLSPERPRSGKVTHGDYQVRLRVDGP